MQKEKLLKKLAGTKYKEIFREALAENSRKGNFVRIYPTKGSDIYDRYFEVQRPFNRYLYKMLYTDYYGIDGENSFYFSNSSQAHAAIQHNKEWEKIKNGYKVKMPKDL